MAQDPRSLHSLFSDAVKYSLFTEKSSRVMGNPKRYGVYFPSKASIEAEQQYDASDNDSTWEFSAPVSPSPRSSSSTSCHTSRSTPAQDIVIRYRAGTPFSLNDTRSSSLSQYSEPDPWEIACPAEQSNVEYTPVAPEQDVKAIYRQSRHEALLSTHREAVYVGRAAGLGQNGEVACQRPGCGDTLANVKALMYHLHIHDIDDRYVVCPRCKDSYEGQSALNAHNCRRRSKSSPASPLCESFRRIFTKFRF